MQILAELFYFLCTMHMAQCHGELLRITFPRKATARGGMVGDMSALSIHMAYV
jgi:hypothetical protein